MQLWVRDTGAGVDPADEERIFQRFGRGTGESRDSGTGLGLAIVEAIAVGHGGLVLLENVPGTGATFVLDLPWVPAHVPDGAYADTPDDAYDGRDALRGPDGVDDDVPHPRGADRYARPAAGPSSAHPDRRDA